MQWDSRLSTGLPSSSQLCQLWSRKEDLQRAWNRDIPVMRDPGSIPRGALMWNRDSSISIVSLHWWPRRDRSLWPRLRRASSRTITRLSCQQCDNPTWSHTALLPWFYACCRSSFQLHNWQSRLLGGSPVESLQSHCIHTQFHRSSGSHGFFPLRGTRVLSPGGYLCETGILLSCYIKGLTHRTSETVYECSEIAGSSQWESIIKKRF
jgi:hypothetical protein